MSIKLWAGKTVTRAFGQRRDRVTHFVVAAEDANQARERLIGHTKWMAQFGTYAASCDAQPLDVPVHQVGEVEYVVNPKRPRRAV